MAHIHAELMAQYAEDAKRYNEPWELWQHGDNGVWTRCTCHPGWHKEHSYRRKPRTIKIGDIEVPEPCKFALAYEQKYYVPNVTTGGTYLYTWAHSHQDQHNLESNFVHTDIRSATLHAKALIEVSKG